MREKRSQQQTTILLVEEEMLTALATAQTIETFGYDVVTARSGEEAVALATQDEQISLILMDIDLGGGIDGTEAARQILAHRHLPVVFLTSHTEEDYVSRIKEITRYGYIVKNSGNFVLKSSIEMAFELFNEHEKTRESEEKYRNLVETTQDWVWAINADGVHTYSNDGLRRSLGYSGSDILNTSAFPIMHPDDAERWREKIREHIADKTGWRDEPIRWLGKDGSIHVFESSATPIVATSGEVVGFHGLDREITERRRAEAETLAYQRQLEAMKEIGVLATSTLELTPLLRRILAGVLDAIGTSVGMIFLKDRTTGQLSWGASIGLSNVFVSTYEHTLIEPGEGLTGRIAETGSPIFIQQDCSHDPRVARMAATEEHLNSFIGVPLFAENDIVGVMNILSRAPVMLHDRDVLLVSAIGGYVGSAIQNARLFAQLKSTKSALQKSEHHYRSLIEISPVMIGIIDSGGNYQLVNEATEKLLGYSEEFFQGHNAFDFVHKEDRGYVISAFNETQRSGQGEVIYRFRDANDMYHIVSSKAAHIKDTDTYVVYSEDITDEKHAEETLHKTLSLLEETQKLAHLGSWEFDVQKNHLVWSDEVYRIFGISPDAFPTTYKASFEHVHPEDRDRVDTAYSDSVKAGADSYEIEYRVQRPTGEIRQVYEKCLQVKDADGKIMRSLGMVHDITERKHAEDALQRSEKRNRSLLDYSPVCHKVVDRDFTLRYMNTMGFHMLKLEETHDWYGKPYPFAFFPQKHREALTRALHQVKDTNTRVVLEGQACDSEGGSVWLLHTLIPVPNDDGSLDYITVVSSDITERIRVEGELHAHRDHLEALVEERTLALQQEIDEHTRTEDALREAKEAALDNLRMAKEANRLKSEFLANMSHDIRTPMNAVLGFSAILRERLGNAHQYHHYLDSITESGQTLLRLLDDILEFSRIEAGQLRVHPAPLQCAAILSEIHHMFSLKSEKKGLDLITHLTPEECPPVMLDGGRLRQVLMNLVGNAIKFTEHGSVTVECRLSTDEPDDDGTSRPATLHVEVRDTGPGIPHDHHQHIFEAFRQHHAENLGGAGLGLAITKRLLDLMQGTIIVESALHEGTTFRVMLPTTTLPRYEGTACVNTPTDVPACQFHNATILLAEDNASNAAIIREYLDTYPLMVIETSNGQEALEVLQHTRPDLILMDIRMPVLDGYETAQRIRKSPDLHAIPIVALTAYAIKEQRDQYQGIYDAYLNKPVMKATLLQTLAQFLPHSPLPVSPDADTPESGQHLSEKTVETSTLRETFQEYEGQQHALSQASLETFQTEVLPAYRIVKELMSIDETILFAETVMAWGESTSTPPIIQYGKTLLRTTLEFDITQMKRLLEEFAACIPLFSEADCATPSE